MEVAGERGTSPLVPAGIGSAATARPLQPTERVVVVGLQAPSILVLNGATGTVKEFNEKMQRWKVHLDSGLGIKMFRPANLMRLRPENVQNEQEVAKPRTGVRATPVEKGTEPSPADVHSMAFEQEVAPWMRLQRPPREQPGVRATPVEKGTEPSPADVHSMAFEQELAKPLTRLQRPPREQPGVRATPVEKGMEPSPADVHSMAFEQVAKPLTRLQRPPREQPGVRATPVEKGMEPSTADVHSMAFEQEVARPLTRLQRPTREQPGVRATPVEKGMEPSTADVHSMAFEQELAKPLTRLQRPPREQPGVRATPVEKGMEPSPADVHSMAFEQEVARPLTRLQRPTREQPGVRATPVEKGMEPSPADVHSRAFGAPMDVGTDPKCWQADMEQRLADLARKITAVSNTVEEHGIVIEDFLCGSTSDKMLQQIKALESASAVAIDTLRSEVDVSVSRLCQVEDQLHQKEDSLNDLKSHVHRLQDSLEREGALPKWSIHAGLHRQHFEAACKASAWHADATLDDVARQENVALLILRFVEPADFPALRGASKLAAVSAISRSEKAAVQGELQNACAALKAEPERPAAWRGLMAAIEVGKAAEGDDYQIRQAAELLLRGAAEHCRSREEFMDVVLAAEEAGVDDADIHEMMWEVDTRLSKTERLAEAQRKLRIATSWASSHNPEGLRQVIAEAEDAMVDAAQIAKARQELAFVRQQEHSHRKLRDVLQEAKPSWSHSELEGALSKLSLVDIVTVPELVSALSSDKPDNFLNDVLRKARCKPFAMSTLRSLRHVLPLDD